MISAQSFVRIIAITSLLLAGCSHVYFTDPQPAGGRHLTSIPEELHGTWMNDDEGVRIEAAGFTEVKVKRDSLTGSMDTVFRLTPLSDTFCIYRSKDLYILHFRDKTDGPWEIAVMDKQQNGDIHLYYTTDPHLFSHDPKLHLEWAKYSVDEEDITVDELDPELELSGEFHSALYSGQMKHKTLRSIVREQHLINIFRRDGKLISVSQD